MPGNTRRGIIAGMDRAVIIDPDKLRAARGTRTQAEIAAMAGLPQPHYARLETGSRPDPRLSTAARVARALGVRVDDLLGGKNIEK